MSKKKFIKGLESVFEGADSLQEESVALVDAPTDAPAAQKVKRIKAKGSSKDFTSDLNALFEEAMQDHLESDTSTAKSKPTKAASRPASKRKASSGLDTLIRKTISVKAVKDDAKGPTKRVTFSVNKRKLEKLKQIARAEKAYLKDILSELIGEYIKAYEEE